MWAKVYAATLPDAAVKLFFVALAALVAILPAAASARSEGPSLTVVDVPLHGERALSGAQGRLRFDLVGLHWQGPGSVEFRVRSAAGRWSPWHVAAPEADDRPDLGTAEARASRGWRLGSPWWVGASTRIEYRLGGLVRRLRAYLVRSPVEGVASTRSPTAAGEPAIVTRAGWNADESLRQSPPQYADSLRFAVVHHTAGSNDYTQTEAPAVVRAIELYHVKGNGWNDIGYNFLVDRFGTVYEGRYGGIDRNVVGAHALGFNRGSVGVAVIGTYVQAAPPPAAMDALARLLAWRLDIAHVDPLSTVDVVSGGSERYPAGTPVELRAVSGHRDTGLTECPGAALYAKLDALAAKARSIGLPKIYAPLVTGVLGGEVRFQATLSSPKPWTVSVTDTTGAQIAGGSGVGSAVDWTWDATAVPAGSYTWQMAVTGATPASGTLGSTASMPVTPPATLELTSVAADPQTISPNGDGEADTSTLTYTTTAQSMVTVTVVDASGQDVGVLQSPTDEAAGTHTATFTGEGLPDGAYQLRVDAAGAEATVSQTANVLVTRTLEGAGVAPSIFSPNGDGRADRVTVRFTLLNPAAVRVRVLRDRVWIATPFAGELPAGRHVVRWDGTKLRGRLLDGDYAMEVEATDAVTTSAVALPFASDTRAPTVRILNGAPLRVSVTEPAVLMLRIDGAGLSVRTTQAGVVRIPWTGRARHVRVVAWDAAGNVSRPVFRG